MPTIQEQLATEWAADHPDCEITCAKCGERFPMLGPSGVASIKCPACFSAWSDGVCAGLLASLLKRRAEIASEPEAPASPAKEPGERATVNARSDPSGLDDVIGNAAAVGQIRLSLDAHKARLAVGEKRAFPHLALFGPAGLGKSMLAHILGRELKARVHVTLGQSLGNPAKVCEVLCQLKSGDILFIDELHGLSKRCQETLYLALEDGIIIPPTRAGKAPAESKPIRLPSFTLIGASTDEWGIEPSLLRRFRYCVYLERLSVDDLSRALSERAGRQKIGITDEACRMIASRALGRPGAALNLLGIAHDAALACASPTVDALAVELACKQWRIDALGLGETARRYMGCLAGGGPVRLNVIASKLDGLARRTVETRVEPDLVYLGLIEKEANGRRLSAAGRSYLKGTP